jgi:mannosyltransferase
MRRENLWRVPVYWQTMNSFLRKRTGVILNLLLLLTFTLRIYGLPQLSLRADEAATVFEAGVESSKLLRMLSRPGPHQPLYYLLLHGWMKVAGDGELAVRYLTLVSGVLMLPLVYVLGRRLFPDRARQVGLWAGLLVAINPMLIWDAQDNRMYPLLAVFNVASFLFSLSILQDRGGWIHWLGYVVSTTLGLYTHYLAAFIIVTGNAVWAILIWSSPQKMRRIGRWLAAQGLVALLFAPWMLRVSTTVAEYTTDFLPAVKAGDMLRRALVGLSLGRSVDAQTGMILAIGFLVTLVLGLLPLAERRRQDQALGPGTTTEAQSLLVLLIYLLVPIACIAIFSVLRFPIFDERYIMLALPPYLLILARGLSNVSGRGPRRWMATFGLIWILIATGYSLRNYYTVPRYMKGIDWRDYVAQLLACAQPGDVLIQNYPDPGLTYHLHDQMPRVLLPMGYPVDVQGTEAELRRLSETYSRIWLQPAKYSQWDSEGLVETWMDRNTLKVAEQEFPRARLARYLPPRSYEPLITPVHVTLGEKVQLVGYALERESEAQNRGLCEGPQFAETLNLHPGERLTLALFWRPLSQLEEDYTVFSHLYDPEGHLRGQMDGQPLGGRYPTSAWQTGETIADKYEIQLDPQAPPGEYQLAVGMYDLVTGVRLSVTGDERFLMEEDRILLTTLQVEHKSQDSPQE